MRLNSYSEMEGYKCNPVLKVKQLWICIITTSKANSLDEKTLGWYNWLDMAHFSQSIMKRPIKTVQWYWYNEKLTFIEPSHVWKTSYDNSQSYLACVETNQKVFWCNYAKIS